MHKAVMVASGTDISGIVQPLASLASGSVCGQSSDGYHHCNSVRSDASILHDNNGYYVNLTCQYCGQTFKCYDSDFARSGFGGYDGNSSGFGGSTAYSNYVSTLPATTIDSTKLYHKFSAWAYKGYVSKYFTTLSGGGSIDFVANVSDVNATCVEYISEKFIIPVSGTYRFVSGSYTGSNFSVSDSNVFKLNSDDSYNGSGIRLLIYNGSQYVTDNVTRDYSAGQKAQINIVFYLPEGETNSFNSSEFYIVLDSPWYGHTLEAAAGSTRPTTLVSNNYVNYGYRDSSNVLHTAPTGTVIVDETNNQIYNPVTGETTAITNWVYDYATRTYTVTTSAGGTITITYGDDAITWNDGTNTYSILYVTGTDSSGTETTIASSGSSADLSIVNSWASGTSHTGDISGMNWNDFMYVFLNLYSNLRDHFQTAFPAFASTMNTDLEEIKNSLGFGNYASDDVTLKSLLQNMQTTLQSIGTNTKNTADNTKDIAENLSNFETIPGSSEGDSGWSIFDLAKQLAKGTWKIVTGGVGVVFGGISGVVSGISSIGNFSDAYGSSSPVYGFYNYTGADIWD